MNKCNMTIDNKIYFSNRDNDLFLWINWIIDRNMSLSEVDIASRRSLVARETISSKTLRAYILSMVPLVETNLKDSIPDKFSILFD